MRFGTVALVGRTNVGKSTLLNAALGEPLAITSPLPQTTRDALLGVMRRGDAQIAFLDTPGVHRPRTELGRRMLSAAYESARSADVVVLMTDIWDKEPKGSIVGSSPSPLHSPWIRPGDREVLEALNSFAPGPRLLVINKVDQVRNKQLLLPMLEAYSKAHDFEALIPTSVLHNDGLDRVLDEIARLVPEGPAGFDEDTLTNRPVLFFVREYVREAVLNQCRSEVPHAVAVSVDRADESPRLLSLSATIHVEKVGQRKIIVGHGGEQIKAIGIAARERIEAMIEKKVHLELFVRITPNWKEVPRQLAELGYEASPDYVTEIESHHAARDEAARDEAVSDESASDGEDEQ